MMAGLPLAFAFPWVLAGLAALPVIWWLLRLTPPRPQTEIFPPLAILARLVQREETPANSPWWLTLLRLTMAALATKGLEQNWFEAEAVSIPLILLCAVVAVVGIVLMIQGMVRFVNPDA